MSRSVSFITLASTPRWTTTFTAACKTTAVGADHREAKTDPAPLTPIGIASAAATALSLWSTPKIPIKFILRVKTAAWDASTWKPANEVLFARARLVESVIASTGKRHSCFRRTIQKCITAPAIMSSDPLTAVIAHKLSRPTSLTPRVVPAVRFPNQRYNLV